LKNKESKIHLPNLKVARRALQVSSTFKNRGQVLKKIQPGWQKSSMAS
jgi:hypothetical protein